MACEERAADFRINHKELTNDQVIKYYDEWSTYDEDLREEEYMAPTETVKLVTQYYPSTERGDLKVIDIGAGTGLAVIELRKHGFKQIDALEPSTQLLQCARDKHIYNKYFPENLSLERPCSLQTGFYDFATAVGCFGPTHIPAELMIEVMRVIKPGGSAFIAVHDTYKFHAMIDVSGRLQQQGKLKILDTVHFPKFRKGIKGVCYILKKPEQ